MMNVHGWMIEGTCSSLDPPPGQVLFYLGCSGRSGSGPQSGLVSTTDKPLI